MDKEFHIPGSEKLLSIIKNFSATERAIFGVLVMVALVSALFLAMAVNKVFLTSIPAHGGKFSEGIVGLPRYVNPVIAFTDVDLDLSTLIYSGLMKYENGILVPDLAKSYTISDDGLVYSFILKDNLRFHDGQILTTDDIEFTIQKVEDPLIKSPRRADWADVTIKKVSATEIQLILKQPYAPFLSNTRLGILPKHIWNKISPDQFIFSQYNIEPIGSGPYRLDKVERDSGGIPIDYSLSSFNRYAGGEPYISNMNIFFYPNEKSLIDGYMRGTISAMARISAHEAVKIASTTEAVRIIHTPLPRIFGIFFNQNQNPALLQKDVRKALEAGTDRNAIIEQVLSGYGVQGSGPVPSEISLTPAQRTGTVEKAQVILNNAGWVMNASGVMEKRDKKGVVQTLEFSITTADAPDLKLTAELIKSQWEKIGARITVKVFGYGDLYQNIIAPRKYDSLLFGESVGKDLDLYAFWHSSQRNAPGLNIAMYVNGEADKILKEARTTTDERELKDLYSKFEKIVSEDVPAVFLYSPEFIYVVPESVKGIGVKHIGESSDRFYGVGEWYVATDSVWKIFDSNNN